MKNFNINDLNKLLDVLRLLWDHSEGFSENTREWIMDNDLADTTYEADDYIDSIVCAYDRVRDFANSYGKLDSFNIVKE